MEVFKEYEVSGTPEQLAGFRERLAQEMPRGWKHSSRFEGIVNGTYDSFVVPPFADIQSTTVALFVKRGSTSTKVVSIVPNERGSLTIRQYNEVLREFISFATPVARDFGLRINDTSEDADITRWISADAAEALLGFSNAANKSTGSAHPLDFDRWVRFIIRVHREKSGLAPDLLGRFLMEELGWREDKAYDLVLQYEFGLGLLKASDAIP